MPIAPVVPEGDALRRAVAWLAEQGTWTPAFIEQACQRFDLYPADEEFLIREFGHTSAERPDPSSAS